MSQIEVVDIALKRLGHITSIFYNHQRLVSWSDIKEVFLWCPYPQCKVVLTALKCLLGYPDSDKSMHPCSQLEHLLFLRQCMIVPTGTLLVDVNSLKNIEILATLHEMIRRKHAISCNKIVVTCAKYRSDMMSKYAHTSFKVPAHLMQRQALVPAVSRGSSNEVGMNKNVGKKL